MDLYETIQDSFTLSLIVCSSSISLSVVVLLMVWLFVRNKDEYYKDGVKVELFEDSH
jgi:hypothetical protein